jgi:hypothetical protein
LATPVEEGEEEEEEVGNDKEDEDDKSNDDEDEDAVGENDDDAADLEGNRYVKPSLYDSLAGAGDGSSAGGTKVADVGPGGGLDGVAPATMTNGEEAVRQSRVLWVVVRLSQQARRFMRQPTRHFVRIVSIFRFYTALAETLPAELLVPLAEPIIYAAYRYSSAFTASANESTLPDVQTLEEALNLNNRQQVEFLAQVAQSCLDAVNNHLQKGGRGTDYVTSLKKVRKTREKKRGERTQMQKLMPVTDPVGAAQFRKARMQKKKESRKRRFEAREIKFKGGVSMRKKRQKLAAPAPV